MANIIRSWSILYVMGVLALGNTGSFASSSNCPEPSGYPFNGCSLPGTIDGSFPYFDQTVSVTY